MSDEQDLEQDVVEVGDEAPAVSDPYAEGYEAEDAAYDDSAEAGYDWYYDENGEIVYVEPEPVPVDPPRSRVAVVVLATLLALSLLGSASLLVVVGMQRNDLRDLREQVQRQERALQELRGVGGGAVEQTIAEVASQVEQIRGLEFRSRPEPEVLSVDEFRERISAEVARNVDREEFATSEKVLRALGVIPDDYDLYGSFIALQQEQISGYYDSETKRIVMPARGGAELSPFDREVLAHELTHALTDQHFDLGRIKTLQRDRVDDEASALVALAEGDAELVRELYRSRFMTDSERDESTRQAVGADTGLFDRAPEFLREVLMFPYAHGFGFVLELYEAGGFDRINDAYREPPVSSAQIMHPVEKYLRRRLAPADVRLPNLRTHMGPAWGELDRGQAGEFDLRLLADHGGAGLSARDAERAAAGWRGGAYVAVEARAGTLVALSTLWDTPREAAEAAELFGRWLPLRYRNRGASFAAGADAYGWAGPEGAGMVVRSGDAVLIVLGPSRATVERARGAFEGSSAAEAA